MSCKYTLLLKKRQAETYCSHGLYKEALAIYKSLLTAAPNIDPDLKSFVQSKIHEIEADMADFSSRREGAFTAQDINRLMQGCSENAGEADRLDCVLALCSVGSYGDALVELKKLIHQDGVKPAYMDPLVDCLTNLYAPGYLLEAIDKFVSDCLPEEAAISFQLGFAENLSRRSDMRRATLLYRHLLAKDDLTEETTARITAALEQFDAASTAPVPPPVPDTPLADSSPKDNSFVLSCPIAAIRTFLKIFNERCRSLLMPTR